MRYITLILSFVAACVSTAPALAQTSVEANACTRDWDARQASPVKGFEPTVSILRPGAFGLSCDVISIYFRYGSWDGETTRPPDVYHLARLTSVKEGRTSTRWADSRQCPALGASLAQLAAIKPPGLAIPGYQPASNQPEAIQIDGDTFRLWNSLGPEFSGNQSTPLGAWTYAALKDLEPCWKDSAPVIPTGRQ